MNNLLDNFGNGTNNFWECNPRCKFIFKDFYKKDKSRGKKDSSVIMWGILLCVHPKSEYYNLEDKKERISKDFIKKKSFSWDDYSDIVDMVRDISLTQAEKSLDNWNEYMMKRDAYLKKTKFYFDEYETDSNGDNILSKTGKPIIKKGTADQLDKSWLASKAMWANYLKIKKELDNEIVKKGKGDRNLSLSDSGDI